MTEHKERVLITSSLPTSTIELNEEEPEITNASALPDGGAQAWRTLLGSMLFQFTGIGYMNAFGVYQDFYLREYLTDYNPSAIGWIGGTQLFLAYFVGIFSGKAIDRGFFHHLMISSTVLHGIALFALSFSREGQYYQVFLAQGVCFGFSTGLSSTPSIAVVSHYFRRHQPLAIGLVGSGAALGAIFHPLILNLMFEGPIGFRNGTRISAAVNVFLLLCANIISRPAFPARVASSWLSAVHFLKDPPFVLAVICSFVSSAGFMFPSYYLQLYASIHSVNAFYLLSLLNLMNFLGRTVTPTLVPCYGMWNMSAAVTMASAVVLLCMGMAQNLAGMLLIAIFYGFFSGGLSALQQASVASLARSPDETGTRLGIASMSCALMILPAQPIAGALLTRELHWLPPILFAGSTLLLTAVFSIFARWFVARRECSWRV